MKNPAKWVILRTRFMEFLISIVINRLMILLLLDEHEKTRIQQLTKEDCEKECYILSYCFSGFEPLNAKVDYFWHPKDGTNIANKLSSFMLSTTRKFML